MSQIFSRRSSTLLKFLHLPQTHCLHKFVSQHTTKIYPQAVGKNHAKISRYSIIKVGSFKISDPDSVEVKNDFQIYQKFQKYRQISKNIQPIFLRLNLQRPQIYHQENTLTESRKVKRVMVLNYYES